eukprot:scaffold11264_cov120-Isochrysis_galbana.AAC.4
MWACCCRPPGSQRPSTGTADRHDGNEIKYETPRGAAGSQVPLEPGSRRVLPVIGHAGREKGEAKGEERIVDQFGQQSHPDGHRSEVGQDQAAAECGEDLRRQRLGPRGHLVKGVGRADAGGAFEEVGVADGRGVHRDDIDALRPRLDRQ